MKAFTQAAGAGLIPLRVLTVMLVGLTLCTCKTRTPSPNDIDYVVGYVYKDKIRPLQSTAASFSSTDTDLTHWVAFELRCENLEKGRLLRDQEDTMWCLMRPTTAEEMGKSLQAAAERVRERNKILYEQRNKELQKVQVP